MTKKEMVRSVIQKNPDESVRGIMAKVQERHGQKVSYNYVYEILFGKGKAARGREVKLPDRAPAALPEANGKHHEARQDDGLANLPPMDRMVESMFYHVDLFLKIDACAAALGGYPALIAFCQRYTQGSPFAKEV